MTLRLPDLRPSRVNPTIPLLKAHDPSWQAQVSEENVSVIGSTADAEGRQRAEAWPTDAVEAVYLLGLGAGISTETEIVIEFLK